MAQTTQTVEEQVRALAQPLWESAARPYGMAVDFWLMAEQMVLEMLAVTTRMQTALLSEPPAPPGDRPVAAPVAQIRALAECMWEAAGRQYEMSQDFWLAAEKHVLAMMRATEVSTRDTWVDHIASLPPSAYLERIRQNAYYMWESAGRQYGRTLDFWLEAERQTLAMMGAKAATAKRGSSVRSEARPAPAMTPNTDATAEPKPAGGPIREPAAEPAPEVTPPASAPPPETATAASASPDAAAKPAAKPASSPRRKRAATAKSKTASSAPSTGRTQE